MPDRLTEADIVKRDVDWVYLDGEAAKRHPLYGAEGWAMILGALIVISVLKDIAEIVIAVVQDVAVGLVAALLISPYAGYKFFVMTRLWQARESFQRHFLILFGIGLVLTVVSLFVDAKANMSSIPTMIFMAAWLTYVLRSARINVTTRKRVSPAGAFVREVITGADPHLPKAAKY
mgnify:CR=1 FL=1